MPSSTSSTSSTSTTTSMLSPKIHEDSRQEGQHETDEVRDVEQHGEQLGHDEHDGDGRHS